MSSNRISASRLFQNQLDPVKQQKHSSDLFHESHYPVQSHSSNSYGKNNKDVPFHHFLRPGVKNTKLAVVSPTVVKQPERGMSNVHNVKTLTKGENIRKIQCSAQKYQQKMLNKSYIPSYSPSPDMHHFRCKRKKKKREKNCTLISPITITQIHATSQGIIPLAVPACVTPAVMLSPSISNIQQCVIPVVNNSRTSADLEFSRRQKNNFHKLRKKASKQSQPVKGIPTMDNVRSTRKHRRAMYVQNKLQRAQEMKQRQMDENVQKMLRKGVESQNKPSNYRPVELNSSDYHRSLQNELDPRSSYSQQLTMNVAAYPVCNQSPATHCSPSSRNQDASDVIYIGTSTPGFSASTKKRKRHVDLNSYSQQLERNDAGYPVCNQPPTMHCLPSPRNQETPDVTPISMSTPRFNASATSTQRFSASTTSTPRFSASATSTPRFSASTTFTPRFSANAMPTSRFSAGATPSSRFSASTMPSSRFSASTMPTPRFSASATSTSRFSASATSTPRFSASATSTPRFSASAATIPGFSATAKTQRPHVDPKNVNRIMPATPKTAERSSRERAGVKHSLAKERGTLEDLEKLITAVRSGDLSNKGEATIKSYKRHRERSKSPRASTPLAGPSAVTLGQPPVEEYPADVDMVDVSVDLQSLDVLNDMQVDVPSPDKEGYYLVVDTNVFMSNLKFVRDLNNISYKECGPPNVYIPWVVIQELDSLKCRNHKNKFQAIDAVRYLFKMLSSSHPRFRGQTAKMANNCKKAYDVCNDDAVLQCCLQLAENLPKEKIILLTNDKNLCNKSFITGITAHTADSLHTEIEKESKQVSGTSKKRKISQAPKVETKHQAKEDPPEDPPKSEADTIMCEIRILLKCILDPCLETYMKEAFGDMSVIFVPKPPRTICDILDFYRKYWISCFGCVLPNSMLKHFEKLSEEFSRLKGHSYTVKEVLNILNIISVISEELLKTMPSIESFVSRVSFLIAQCKTSSGGERLRGVEVKNSNEIVLAVFHHIWELINHLCGMLMDFVGLPNCFSYDKNCPMPSIDDFRHLLPNLYPSMHGLRKSLSKVLGYVDNAKSVNCDDEESCKVFKCLYDSLVQFVPSLQIQAQPPALEDFTIKRLKDFICDPANKEMLKNGNSQLENYFSEINKCIHHPIWKQ